MIDRASILERLSMGSDALDAILGGDSFKAIHDLLPADGQNRVFVYDLAVGMAAWGATTRLVGEYTAEDIGRAPEFAVHDAGRPVSRRPPGKKSRRS